MNKRIERVLSLMHSHESDKNKEDTEILEKDNRIREFRLLKMPVILSKYLISKITCKDLDMQIQEVRTPNECVKKGNGAHAYPV